MKKLIVVSLMLSAFLFAGCSIVRDHSVFTGILGKWKWIRTTGGFAGITKTPESVGFRRHLVFDLNHNYSSYRADTLIAKGHYYLGKKNGRQTIRYEDLQYFPPRMYKTSYRPHRWVKFAGSDTLIMMGQCADCFIQVFVRIK